jgi:hypothetical protein
MVDAQLGEILVTMEELQWTIKHGDVIRTALGMHFSLTHLEDQLSALTAAGR